MTFDFLKHLLSGQTIYLHVSVNNGLICDVYSSVLEITSLELKQVAVFEV